ncbi:PGF-pre-PGF domain-containing protein [Methanosarcina sp. KYL-1]|uniref:PGF-pre-PGF domain-containing protein n=1 Tax=Methanosarcina sp. KYL-1 TaxID=2602068 RepID=UPI00210092E9
MRISPETQSIGGEQDFTLNIYIEPDTSISGAQLDFIFDNSLVNVKEIREGDLLKRTGSTTIFSSGTTDNSRGTVTGIYGLILGKNMVTAPGTFATVDLVSSDRSGVCKLQLSNVVVSNSSGYSIPVTVVNSNIQIGETSKSTSEQTSGGSGGGGGGGGAGSPESTQNIKLKEISQCFITNGVRAKYTFKGDTNDIRYVEFDPKRSFGKTTAIIEMLKEKSSLTPVEPEGQVYQHMNIWIGTDGISNPENLENAVVGFRVDRAWINENGIDRTSITLNHFSDDMWNALETRQTGEDGLYLYFEAETPGFSPFAITGQSSQAFQSMENQIRDSSEIQDSSEAQDLNEELTEDTSNTALYPENEKGVQENQDYSAIIYIAVGIILFLPVLMMFKRS